MNWRYLNIGRLANVQIVSTQAHWLDVPSMDEETVHGERVETIMN